MFSDSLLDDIIALSAQTNCKSLKKNFVDILKNRFPNAEICLFEMIKFRDKSVDNKNYVHAFVDSLNYEGAIACVDDKNELFDSFYQQERVLIFQNDHYRYYHPVRLKNMIDFIVKISRIGKDEFDEVVLGKFIEIFSNVYFLIQSKEKDFLTGLLNRQSLNRMINSAMLTHSPETFDPVNIDDNCHTALAIMDIDYFKHINDGYGHLIGDEVLIIFAQLLKSIFRFNDLVYRYGGEEFVVIVKNVSKSNIDAIFERCRLDIEDSRFPQVEHVTVSIGYTIINTDDMLHALDEADKALYYSKENGRNQVNSYQELLKAGLIEPIEYKARVFEF